MFLLEQIEQGVETPDCIYYIVFEFNPKQFLTETKELHKSSLWICICVYVWCELECVFICKRKVIIKQRSGYISWGLLQVFREKDTFTLYTCIHTYSYMAGLMAYILCFINIASQNLPLIISLYIRQIIFFKN